MSYFISENESYDVSPQELITPEDDWDTIERHLVVGAASRLAAHLLYPKGAVHPDYSHMHVVDRAFKQIVCGVNRFEGHVVYRGIADTTRPARFQFESYGERSTYNNITSPVDVDGGSHDVSQPRMGLTVKYISIGRPNEDEVGGNWLPPPGPAGFWGNPNNTFTSGDDVILSYPWGWVLEKRTGPNIPGTELYMIEDTYVYYYQWRPKG